MAAARQSQEEYDRTQAVPGSFETPTITYIAGLFPELEVIQFVGRGGMGAVYKVRQKNLDRVVALKVFLDRPDDPEFAARFQREARALARLNHPNIVTVHDFGVRDDVHYLVMEYVDGLNLRQLTAEERLSPEMALQMVPQLCDALQYAHDNGVIHRDIKPENLLLDTNGRINIADFGLAKMTGNEFNGTLTRTQQVMGTFNYMAPEQRERPTEVDHRADIYSLGVVIYELLTGELPIGRFQPPSAKTDVNAKLDDVVMRALEKEPDRRYQQASEFKTGFQSVGDYAPITNPVPPVKPPVQTAGFAVAPNNSFERPTGTRCLFAIMSGHEKKGNWRVGNPQMAITIMGGMDLDLRDVQASEVNLNLFTLMGATEVVVPHGAEVDLDGLIIMGATTDKVLRRPNTPPTMHVRIRSWGAMGGCDVRTPTAKETRMAEALNRPVKRSVNREGATFPNIVVAIYKMFAMLVTLAIPVFFIANSFDIFNFDYGKMAGVITAIAAGFLWSWVDYLRVLISARPNRRRSRELAEISLANETWHARKEPGDAIRIHLSHSFCDRSL